ncbi:MAG: hypothetical protein AAF483_21770 [Planctomycetota bacterium]
MIWELYQTQQIASAQSAANTATRRATSVEAKLSDCEEKIDSLALVCQAMWELLSAKTPDADAILRAKIEEIDLRDGIRDGKMGRVSKTCPECSRPVHARHRRCMYCGHELERENILQK